MCETGGGERRIQSRACLCVGECQRESPPLISSVRPRAQCLPQAAKGPGGSLASQLLTALLASPASRGEHPGYVTDTAKTTANTGEKRSGNAVPS